MLPSGKRLTIFTTLYQLFLHVTVFLLTNRRCGHIRHLRENTEVAADVRSQTHVEGGVWRQAPEPDVGTLVNLLHLHARTVVTVHWWPVGATN